MPLPSATSPVALQISSITVLHSRHPTRTTREVPLVRYQRESLDGHADSDMMPSPPRLLPFRQRFPENPSHRSKRPYRHSPDTPSQRRRTKNYSIEILRRMPQRSRSRLLDLKPNPAVRQLQTGPAYVFDLAANNVLEASPSGFHLPAALQHVPALANAPYLTPEKARSPPAGGRADGKSLTRPHPLLRTFTAAPQGFEDFSLGARKAAGHPRVTAGWDRGRGSTVSAAAVCAPAAAPSTSAKLENLLPAL